MIKIISVTRLLKVPLVRRTGLIIDFFFEIWDLFVFCFLFFVIYNLVL